MTFKELIPKQCLPILVLPEQLGYLVVEHVVPVLEVALRVLHHRDFGLEWVQVGVHRFLVFQLSLFLFVLLMLVVLLAIITIRYRWCTRLFIYIYIIILFKYISFHSTKFLLLIHNTIFFIAINFNSSSSLLHSSFIKTFFYIYSSVLSSNDFNLSFIPNLIINVIYLFEFSFCINFIIFELQISFNFF